MYNWSTDTSKIKNREQKTIWKLEQMVNFGLAGEKISKKLVKKYWNKLSLDSNRKKFLRFLIWNKNRF